MGKVEDENVKTDKLHRRLEAKVMGIFNKSGKNVKTKDTPETEKGKAKEDVNEEVVNESKKPENASQKENTDFTKNAEETGEKKEENPPEKSEKKKSVSSKDKETKEKKSRDKSAMKSEEKAAEERPKESLEELRAHKEEIEALLSSIEDSYRDATLPEKTYHEVKENNEKKLEEIEHKIKILESLAPEKTAEEKARPAEKAPVKIPSPARLERPGRIERQARNLVAVQLTPSEGQSGLSSIPVIGDLEKRIQERLKSALETASVEITDKRIKKIDEKLNDVELEIKELKKAAETVAGYDRQFNLMNTEVEKTKAVVESAKEARNRMDDKMQRITDSFAEIRSMVYQREAKSKEQEVVLDKLKDTIAQVDTARILKEFTTRDEQLRDVNTRIEKLERGLKMLSETMNKIKGLMTDVGSLENVLKASKHAGEKLERIQEIEERIRAVSSRLDSTYVDMKKRLDEFAAYRVKQDRLDGMGNDLIKNVEEITRRLADFSTKDDLDVVKKTIDKLKDQVKAAAEGPALPPDLRRLQEEKEDIEALLSTLEENLRNKEITQDEYNKTRSMNLERIKEIEEKIQAYTTKHTAAEKKEEPEPAGAEGGKHKKSMLLAKLRESYESGEISRAAYEKSKKLLLKK